ncbi:MAG TPA: BTAD domain-containing putative transcriptional regulator [Pilimelia sp.]|nr:BTAD domain-containing putative transcriptional regulator [Pilimelia sp.]
MSGHEQPAVRLEVLGPLQAWQGDSRLSLGPVQQRVVLAVLALHANRPLGREQLIEAIWGPAAPAYAVNLLQKHVSRLRRVLEPTRPTEGPSQLLSWTGAGYQLSIPADRLDLDVFDREVSRARAARAAGDLPGAAQALHAALGLWRGPAFDGLTSPLLDAERDRLAERRISALEERIEIDLAVGNDQDLVAELRQLVADHPLRERLRGLLMLALYRSGRQGDALAAFREAHRYLLDELGVEPTAQLQELHRRILANDPSLAAPAVAHSPPAGGISTGGGPTVAAPTEHRLPTPAQLPHGMPDFTGRDAELDRLHALLAGDGGDSGRAVMITAIAGTAGVGKTSLAVHWAHQVSHRFPDGQLYVNLRGFDPNGSAMEPGEALRGFLDAFGVPSQRTPVSLEAQAALYRSLLAGRRVLVLLDNARDTDQVRPLLPGSPGCLVLVTSRSRLSGLVTAGAVPLALDLLTATEARDLLIRRLGKDRVGAEPEAVDDIITACARLPLALSIVAARAAVHPRFTLAALADELREARGGLDAFVGEDAATDARAVLSWSYRMLSDPAARLFRLLGLHPGPDISASAVASLVGLPPARVRPLLGELTSAHLLEERTPGRFGFHDLLRAYATEQTHTLDTEADRRAATERVLDHYLHTAHAADRLLYAYREPFALASPGPGVTPVTFTGSEQALAWFTAEHQVLLAAVDLAAEAGFDTHTWQLAWRITAFLNYQGHWHDWAASQCTALEAARRMADRNGQALTHQLLGIAYMQLGRFDDASTHAQQAVDLFGELGHQVDKAHSHLGLGWVLGHQGRDAEALIQAQQALELFQAAGDKAGEADALSWVGRYHAQLGDHKQALISCQRSLDLNKEFQDRPQLVNTWYSLGYAHYQLGHNDEAITCYQRALELWRNLGDRDGESRTLVHLGDAYHATGDTDSARAFWRQALKILDELGHADAERLRAKLDAGERDRQGGGTSLAGPP